MPEIRTFDTTATLLRTAAGMVASAARESVRLRGRFVWFLSGGETPGGLFRLLVHEHIARIPWEQISVFWGDEQWEPLDSEKNNAHIATEHLLSQAPIPTNQIHRILTTGISPQDSAAAMERQLRSMYYGIPPRPDLILLGLGRDGHTASLFPGTPAIAEDNLLYTANYVPKLDQWRVTATVPLLNAARQVLFVVTGEEKAEAVRQVIEPQPETIVLPASLIRPTKGKLTWLLDSEAGSLLSPAE